MVAQKEEPDEVSKEFANKLGVDEKNIVSTGNTIKSTYYSGIDTSKVNYDTKIIEVSVCLKNTTEEEKEVPITYLSLETNRACWNSNFSGTFDGQYRTLQFYGRKIRTRRGKGSYLSVRNMFHMVS